MREREREGGVIEPSERKTQREKRERGKGGHGEFA